MSFARFNSGGSAKSGFSRFNSNQPAIGSSDPNASLQRSINNARLRIRDSGFDVKDADKRNFFEKATNLPEGQNAFFDILELLGRPGQAILNPIKEGLRGDFENPLQNAWKGLSGQERARGSEVAELTGIESKAGKFGVGLAIDIATDPLTFVPGGVLAKGVKSSAGMIAQPLKAGYKALETPGMRSFRETAVEPLAEKTKDALGYMFKPNYKADETLFGDKNDALQRLSRETENSRKFMQEDALKTVSNAAKVSGGVETGEQVGRVLESPLRQFDEAGNAMPRVSREIPNDPKIKEAANILMNSNRAIRNFAEENGISIQELEGYMSHVWSAEERSRRSVGKSSFLDRGNFGKGNPNKKILDQRKHMGSVEDVNERLGRKMFEPNAFYATAQGQRRLIDYIHAVSFRRKVLSNPDFAMKYEKGMDIPPNAVKIDTNNYKFLKDSNDVLESLGLADEIGGEYVTTKAAKQLLDRYQHLNTDEGSKAFLKAFDTVQNFWKRAALFSPGYHVRNAAGAMFNNWVGGMDGTEIIKYTKDATRELADALKGKESDLFKEYRKQGLSSSNMSQVEFAKYGEEPEKAIDRSVKRMSATGLDKAKNIVTSPFETSRSIGDMNDQIHRFALYKWAKDQGMDAEKAAAKVREVQFDYTDLTNFERNVRRVIPFYAWMRNNIPFQIRNFINDPRKYAWANEARLNAQSTLGIDEETAPEFMKEQFSLPITGDGERGKMLAFNLPLGDLTKLSQPGKLLVDAITPLAKLPAELSLNRNFFFNKPIEKFEGQEKQFRLPGTGVEFGIPSRAAYAAEQLTGQPGRGLASYLQSPESVDQDTKFRLPTLGINAIYKDYDMAKARTYELYDELNKLQDYIDFIEQQTGTRPRTVSEIGKSPFQP